MTGDPEIDRKCNGLSLILVVIIVWIIYNRLELSVVSPIPCYL
jgi:hypothetical protein